MIDMDIFKFGIVYKYMVLFFDLRLLYVFSIVWLMFDYFQFIGFGKYWDCWLICEEIVKIF